MATTPPQPILDLDALTEHRLVRIKGKNIELLNPEELSPLDYHKLAKAWKGIFSVMEKDEPSDAELEDVQKKLDWTCRMVLLASDEVHAQLSDGARFKIVTTFMQLQLVQAPPAGAKKEDAPRAPVVIAGPTPFPDPVELWTKTGRDLGLLPLETETQAAASETPPAEPNTAETSTGVS